MDLKITDLTQEQYNKIMDFSKTVVERKYKLSIWQDDCIDCQNEIDMVFEGRGIEDIKFLNNLNRYTLFMENNQVGENWSEEDMQDLQTNEGYHLFYIESYIHSGIHIYEYSGSLRDRWDCGIAGIMALKGDKKECRKAFEEYLKVYNKISDGDFYGYTVMDNFGELIDSCGGFGDVKDIKEYLPKEITEQEFQYACNNIQY